METALLAEFKQHSIFRLKEGQRMIHFHGEGQRRTAVVASWENGASFRKSIVAHLWEHDPVCHCLFGRAGRPTCA